MTDIQDRASVPGKDVEAWRAHIKAGGRDGRSASSTRRRSSPSARAARSRCRRSPAISISRSPRCAAGSARPRSTRTAGRSSRAASARSSRAGARRCGCCARSATSSSAPRLFSPGRPGEKSRGALEDVALLAQHPHLLAPARELLALAAREDLPAVRVDLGLADPAAHRGLREIEIAGDLRHRLLAALAEGHDLRLILLAERPSRPPALICALHASTSFPGTDALSWMSVRTGQAHLAAQRLELLKLIGRKAVIPTQFRRGDLDPVAHGIGTYAQLLGDATDRPRLADLGNHADRSLTQLLWVLHSSGHRLLL